MKCDPGMEANYSAVGFSSCASTYALLSGQIGINRGTAMVTVRHDDRDVQSHVRGAGHVEGNRAAPEFNYGLADAAEFRRLLLSRGAVMLRNAADPELLDQIKQRLEGMFAQYASVPADELQRRAESQDPVERDFWEQIKLSHIFDRTFKPHAGISFFDVIRKSGLWEFASRAFPETAITESAVCNCRRMIDGDLRKFVDRPIEFHVDAQFFYVHQLSVNFWTPLVDCGVTAPGLKVVTLGVRDTMKYLEFNEDGYEPKPNDIAHMHKFRCEKMDLQRLNADGLGDCIWAPEFRKGDILAFTNFTMHATHYLPAMTQPRTSVEVRIDLPTARF
jgi:hypothetical protein